MTMPDVIYAWDTYLQEESGDEVLWNLWSENEGHEKQSGAGKYHHDRILQSKEREIEVLREGLERAKMYAHSWIMHNVMGSEVFICGRAIRDVVNEALAEADTVRG